MPGCTPSKPSGGSRAPASATPCPADETKTAGNRIDIVFDPAKSSTIKNCERIVHVQFIRIEGDGTILKPGDYYSGYKYRDKVVSTDTWWIDHLQTETTPDYQQGTGDGKKNGGTAKATMMDAPQTGGGDKGFYNAATNPTGWKKVRYEFTTYAWCMKGPDCGHWYEGVTWEYVKTWEDARDGRPGTSKVLNNNVPPPPTGPQIDGFNKFNTEKGFTPCSP